VGRGVPASRLMHTGGIDGKGGIGGESIRLRSGTASPKQVQAVLDEIAGSPALRNDIITKASSVRESMNSGAFGTAKNRASEMHFLIKALENMR